LRILIVGAGVGGATLAALLDQRGVAVRVIEKAPSSAHAGYMIGLYSLGHRVLYGLGLWEKFAAESVECKHYASHDDHGHLISEWALDAISGRFGPLLSCTRPALVELLRSGLTRTRVEFGRSITTVVAHPDSCSVTFDDGSTDTFDLVVGADGMGSAVRRLVFGEQPRYDTRWGGWVWWAPRDVCPPDTFLEYWGAGRFLGLYPTSAGVGIFAGAPAEGEFASSHGRRARLLEAFAGLGERADRVLASLPGDAEEMFFWHLSDVRSAEWARDRVVLLGDSAAGFLPTAGIGASMAMESAAVLADELGRTDARFVDHALALYVKRRKHRVEAIQDDSRKLARLMFVSSSPIAAIRNYASKFMTLEMAMGSITKAFEQPI
jgi:2-polyprenyl-6-methoxyphenol hydroxylase-like FAD-dependent oxidoreductase